MRNLPFRVLFREFLFRIVDLELLAPKGDMSKLLGQFAALLIFLSLVFAGLGLFFPDSRRIEPWLTLMLTWSAEHFLIATTMLVVGLFAVLSWDSTFPNRRDVFVLAPLPLRSRTLFLAKVAAVAAALGFTVAALHVFSGLVWPLVLHSQAVAQTTPVLTWLPAMAPVGVDGLRTVLDHDLAQAWTPGSGALAPETGAGLVVGVVQRDVRRIFAFGTAKPDSIFEIGSISKTFTGLALAQMAAQEKVSLNEPVRLLLPSGTVTRPAGSEITLLDLATHYSGLPGMPDNIARDTYAAYHPSDLYAYLAKHGVTRPANTSFRYSNLGFSLLGQALANRAGISYPELILREITSPLGLRDTVIALSPEQQTRFIQGHDLRHRKVHPRDLEAMAGSGGIRSTAGDMLTYLEAQLHPEKLESANAGTLPSALVQSQKLRANVVTDVRIGLAWVHNGVDGTYWASGGTGGYSSYTFFNPKAGCAAVVLLNHRPDAAVFAELLGEHVQQRLAGEPAISLDSVAIPAGGGVADAIRFFAAYWATMLAAGAFIFCSVLGIQGLAAQMLPRRWFLRASSFLQMAAFCFFVGGYFLQPIPVAPATLVAAQNGGALSWSPSYWFLGLFQQLSGSPALGPLARRAWIGLAVSLSVTAVAYLLSYFRTLGKIVEEPDIVASFRGWNWLPLFGNPLATAVTQFSIRTLLRSRQHRMILAFYWGIVFAFVIFIAKAPGVQRQLGAGNDLWHEPNVPLLVASVLVLCAAIVGIRVVASMPLELRANWIFLVTPVQGGPRSLAAVRKALYILGLAPVWSASAALFLSLWPWQPAVGHLAVLGLLGISLTELCLFGFHKIPFTCSYLPGKSHANMAVLGFLALVLLIVKGAGVERRALGDPASFVKMVVVLAILAGFARWRTSALAKSQQSKLRFDEQPTPAIFALDLHRDGMPPI